MLHLAVPSFAVCAALLTVQGLHARPHGRCPPSPTNPIRWVRRRLLFSHPPRGKTTLDPELRIDAEAISIEGLYRPFWPVDTTYMLSGPAPRGVLTQNAVRITLSRVLSAVFWRTRERFFK